MLDLKQLRREPDPVRAALARRHDGSEARLDRVLELDERTRALRPEVESLKAEQNAASKAIGAAKREGRDAEAEIAAMQEVAQRVKALSQELADADAELQAALATLPNPPDPTAADEDTTLREEGDPGIHPHPPRDHLEVAGSMIDMESGAKVSGSRFAYLRGDLVLVELALFRWALEILVEEGFEPVVPPVLVREEALYGTGFLPDTEQQIYRLADDELYLVGTSEVPLASLHAGEILDAGALPLRYAGMSPCFRREAGAAGRDTRGILRELGIPYRVVNIGANDLGASAAKKYDLEAWMPGQQRYREVTSTSNTTDFQSRRLDIRYRAGDGRPRHVHTLNGTAVTWRHLIALLENHQRDDGTVPMPEVLQRWGAPEILRA